MDLINYIWLYLTVGVACAFCFDVLFTKLDIEPATWSERLMWFVGWPVFIFVFIWGLYNDDED